MPTTTYRYRLQPYKGPASRHQCPQCNQPRTFSLYIDTTTGQTLHPTIGRCNRMVNCGYHYKPKQYFAEFGPLTDQGPRINIPVQGKPIPTSFMDETLVTQSMQHPERNNLVMFMADYFSAIHAEQLVTRYRIGRSNHWPGATIFWQTDMQGRTHAGKIMLYNRHTGKRVKEPFNHITWAHKVMELPQYNTQQCLFGLHLLRNNHQPVAIVESEKTALIASLFYPSFTWLACGGLTNLNAQTLQPLKGRKIILVPDLNGYQTWQQKAQTLNHITPMQVTDFLQNLALDTDKQQGYDLADYLVGREGFI